MFEFILEILKYIGFPSLLLFFVQRHYSKKDKLLEKE